MLTFSFRSKYVFTLYPFFKEQAKSLKCSFLNQKAGTITIDSEKQKIYYCLGKRKEYKLDHLALFWSPIVAISQMSFNLAIDEFALKPKFKKQVIRTFMHAFYSSRMMPWTKKKAAVKVNKKKIHLITQEKIQWLKSEDQQIQITESAKSLAKKWQDMAPNLLTSVTMAEEIKTIFAKIPAIKCRILTKKEIEAENMNLLLAVNAGSNVEPRVVVMEYVTNTKLPRYALIGKGITFDTGGYSLKPSNYQLGMKYDMSGAAIVCAAMKAIAEQKISANLVAVACLTDNRIGQTATLVESVVRSKNGKTVEITNTDAEGRLVLADGITYAIRNLKATHLIDLSTLTGSILVALGEEITGAFTNKSSFYKKFALSAFAENELIWELPVIQENFKRMRSSKVADLLNATANYYGGSSNAAAFLMEFAENKPFLHLDIAGTANKNKRGTAIMLQTLIHFFRHLAKKSEKPKIV